MTFIVKRNDYFYFRIWIPLDLRQHFKCKEICKSLKTDSLQTAKTLVLKLLYDIERLFLHVRSGMFTSDEIKKLVTDYLHRTLERKEQHRAIAPLSYTVDGNVPSEEDWVGEGVNACQQTIRIMQRQLALNQFTGLETKVKQLLEGTDIHVEPGSKDYNKLCRELIKAEISIFNIEIERIQGNYENRFDSYLDKIITPIPTTTVIQSQPVAALPEPTVLLSKIVEEHIKEALLAEAWTEKTLAENSSIYKVMLEMLGDRDIKTIDNQMLLDFRSKLAKLPANRDKVARFKGKTIDKILTMRNVEPMSKSTVNKYLVRIGTLFKWATKMKFVMVNYAEGLSFSKTTSAQEERDPYSVEDIKRLLTHLKLDPKQPQEYWIPLVSLYSGLRLEEICQLHMSDIIEIDDIPCISVNDDGGKRVKTKSSKRVVPIHPELIRLGFMDYIEVLRTNNVVRVWPRLTKGRDGYSHVYGKKYQKFNRKYVSVNPKRVFHSFRHALANTLKQAGVQEILIAEILGHENASMTSGRYGKKYEPKILLDALQKLNYGSIFVEIEEVMPSVSSQVKLVVTPCKGVKTSY